MMELGRQIHEADFEKILNYYRDKGQFHHQTLTALYLYTSMQPELMFRLRWVDVYDYEKQVFCPRQYFWPFVKDRIGTELSPALIVALVPILSAHMKASDPLPEDYILDCGDAGALGFSYRVIQEAMASIGRCCLVEPRDMRRVFKYTEMYRRDMGIHRAPARRSRPYLILLNGNGNLSGFKWNKGYETCVTKRDLIRLLNDCLERRQFQSHVILTLYLYSDISVMDITQIRWRDVYNFGKGIFYSRITPANVPMSREMTQALLLYMARCPDVQPADYILTYQGKPLKSNTVFRRVRKAMSQLTDLRLARFGELRVWARQTLTAQPPRVPPKPHPFFSRINALQARANR